MIGSISSKRGNKCSNTLLIDVSVSFSKFRDMQNIYIRSPALTFLLEALHCVCT